MSLPASDTGTVIATGSGYRTAIDRDIATSLFFILCQPRSDTGSTLAASSAETTGARNGQRGAFAAYLDGSIIGRCCNCIGTHEVNAGIAIADNAAISDVDIAECHIGTGSDENLPVHYHSCQ